MDLETQTRLQVIDLEKAITTLENREPNGQILGAMETLQAEQNRLQKINQALRLANSLRLSQAISQPQSPPTIR